MANTPDYSWPPMENRKIIGKPIKRLDGPQKASGRAKYTSDLKMKDMLYAAYLTCPHAHARVTSIDTSAAEKMNGVKAVHVIAEAGTELQWHGQEIAAVAATTEEIAREAVRKIKVDYEVLPHFVNEADLGKAGSRGKAAGEKVTGDPDKAMQDAEAVSDGVYGIPVITHCCLEPHGCVIQWQGDQVHGVALHPVRHRLGRHAGAQPQGPRRQYQGQDGLHRRRLRQQVQPRSLGRSRRPPLAEGRRQAGQDLPGSRHRTADRRQPSQRLRQDQNRRQEGRHHHRLAVRHLGQRRFRRRRPAAPAVRLHQHPQHAPQPHVGLRQRRPGAGLARAQQPAGIVTSPARAIEDFAAKIGMDPMDGLRQERRLHARAPNSIATSLQKAAELSEWSKLWKPRGSQTGAVRRGLGIGVNAWGGAGHACTARTTINPDGSVLLEMGTQDLGTGTRTIMTQVAAETLGLPDGPDQARHRRQQPAAGRKFRRFHHRRRRLLGHPQSRASTPSPSCSKRSPRRLARSPRNWKPSTARSASKATPRRA